MIRIKKQREIEILKEGGRRHGEILRALKDAVRPGISTRELNLLAEQLVYEYGDAPAFLNYTPEGARRPYPATLCVSVNDAIVHGIPNESTIILKEGDIVSLDLGLVHEGMITDAALTVGVGVLQPVHEHLIAATDRALFAGIDAARGGARIGDIGAAIEEVARKTKFYLCEGLSGHGVGYEVHEDPYVPNTGVKGEGELLIPGMVIAIEPMLAVGTSKIMLARDGYTYKTKDGSYAAHAEHTILITEKSPVILTELP